MLRTLIIDDEASGRNTLKAYTEKYCPQIEIVGMGADIITAEALIKKEKPDLVFLDIEMPRGTAFDLIDKLDAISFDIIFVTAYSEYAVRAFNLSAAYYLLKPVDIDELIVAVIKVTEQQTVDHTIDRTSVLIDNLKIANAQHRKVVIPLMDGFEVVRLQDVIYLIADDNFVHFKMINGRSIMVCRSLKFYEKQLSDAGFLRIHRSHMINLDYVKRYHKGKTGSVTMIDDKELDIAQSKKTTFLEFFKK